MLCSLAARMRQMGAKGVVAVGSLRWARCAASFSRCMRCIARPERQKRGQGCYVVGLYKASEEVSPGG